MEPPEEVYSVVPEAWLRAMASACSVVSASNPRSLAATAAAPKFESTAMRVEAAFEEFGRGELADAGVDLVAGDDAR